MAALEVADIFRRHGEAYRQAHGSHLGRTERRIMGAIEACRTATLGGHIERCADCGLIRVAYNSCRNRHCPKCQGPARAAWLAERQAWLYQAVLQETGWRPAELARKLETEKRAISKRWDDIIWHVNVLALEDVYQAAVAVGQLSIKRASEIYRQLAAVRGAVFDALVAGWTIDKVRAAFPVTTKMQPNC
jgi:hypothetical protein